MSGARIHDLPPITPDRVLQLKREATELKQREHIKQTAALARIAQREGFPSWETLVAKAGGTEAVRGARPATEERIRRQQRYGENT
jgi:hypothetical protein